MERRGYKELEDGEEKNEESGFEKKEKEEKKNEVRRGGHYLLRALNWMEPSCFS